MEKNGGLIEEVHDAIETEQHGPVPGAKLKQAADIPVQQFGAKGTLAARPRVEEVGGCGQEPGIEQDLRRSPEELCREACGDFRAGLPQHAIQ